MAPTPSLAAMIDDELKIAFGNLVAAVADLGERYAVVDPPAGQARPALDRYTVGEFCDRFGPPAPDAPPVTRAQVLDVVREVLRADFDVAPGRVTEESVLLTLLVPPAAAEENASSEGPDERLPAAEPDVLAPAAGGEASWWSDDRPADRAEPPSLPEAGEATAVPGAQVMASERRIVSAFQHAAATAPERAVFPEELGVDPEGAPWVRLRDHVMAQSADAPGTWYLDVDAWEAMRRRRWRTAGAVLLGAALIMVVPLLIWRAR